MRAIGIRGVPYGAAVLLACAGVASAQAVVSRSAQMVVQRGGSPAEVINVSSDDDVPTIVGSPFTADATTEFTQVLADGNRIERRYTTSLARDGKGRTRREQEIALIGPLMVFERNAGGPRRGGGPDPVGPPPRFVSITDPVAGVTYSLDERGKVAHRGKIGRFGTPGTQVFFGSSNGSGAWTAATAVSTTTRDSHSNSSGAGRGTGSGAGAANVEAHVVVGSVGTAPSLVGSGLEHFVFEATAAAPGGRSESLGTAEIEGVKAEGTRSTMTIPAGAMGNQLPIDVVTERWFSPDLKMAVRITRRDPRSGETVYRLTNLSRNEPPPDLFAPPSDYEVRDMGAEFQDRLNRLNRSVPAPPAPTRPAPRP